MNLDDEGCFYDNVSQFFWGAPILNKLPLFLKVVEEEKEDEL